MKEMKQENQTIARNATRKLIEYFAAHHSMPAAQAHYKLEEWAAVETFAFFERDMPGWFAAGTLPYFSTNYSGQEKWTDVYARFIQNDAAKLHLWIEFKAIPFGATSWTKTLGHFGKDVGYLAGLQRDLTAAMWRTHVNPRTGRSQKSWFSKHKLPGSIDNGEFIGVAILFAALSPEKSMQDIHDRIDPVLGETDAGVVFESASLCGVDGLACIACLVPMADERDQ